MFLFILAEIKKLFHSTLLRTVQFALFGIIVIVFYLKICPDNLNYNISSITFSNMHLTNSLVLLEIGNLLSIFIFSYTFINEFTNNTYLYLHRSHSRVQIFIAKFMSCIWIILLDYIVILLISTIEGVCYHHTLSDFSISLVVSTFLPIILNYIFLGLISSILTITLKRIVPSILLFIMFLLKTNIDNYITRFSDIFLCKYFNVIGYHSFSPINKYKYNTINSTFLPSVIPFNKATAVILSTIILELTIFVFLYLGKVKRKDI